MKWIFVSVCLLALGCGQTIEPDCVPECDGVECGPDGCGGECPPGCLYRVECSQAGRCEECPADYPVMCDPNGCWSENLNCDTVGFCSAEDGCWGCFGSHTSFCCEGVFICCAPDEPYACSDGWCYASPAECEETVCEDKPNPTCPR